MDKRCVTLCRGPRCAEKDPSGSAEALLRADERLSDVVIATRNECMNHCPFGPNAQIDGDASVPIPLPEGGVANSDIVTGLNSGDAPQKVVDKLLEQFSTPQ